MSSSMTDPHLVSGSSEYIVIIICSEKTVHGTSVKYASDAGHEVYVVSRVPSFVPYLEKLLEKMTRVPSPSVRVVLVNENVPILVDVLRLILHKSAPELILKRRHDYLQKYKDNLLRISGSALDNGPAFDVTLPVGHGDLPQAFDLAIVQDTDDIDEVSYLSEENVFTQQALRFIALKHALRFGAVSGLSALIGDTGAMVSLTTRLFRDSPGVESIIFKPEGMPVTGDVYLHQYIPVGWDSWNKILLVAKAIPRNGEMAKLLHSEVQIGEFNDIYHACFENNDASIDSGPQTTAQSKGNANQTGAEDHAHLVSGNVCTSSQIYNSTYQRAREQLSEYFPIDKPDGRLPSKPDPPFTYAQFIQSLQDE
ncbi:hypothetical protein JCM33374_g3149 [Metschnikowia sp. JCM 33374]|nr:hypothetical protein JCM33374_g3149 [Metschnikowia sp. JCM 33374]